jgi:hypothetical protein
MSANPAQPPMPAHIPTSDERGALLVEAIQSDGSVTIRDANGQLATARLGFVQWGGDWTIILVGPVPADQVATPSAVHGGGPGLWRGEQW